MSTWDEIAPDGIDESHQQPLGGWRRHASPFSVIVFGVIVAVGLSGLVGHERDWTASGDGVDLVVHAPEVIRNGEFLELRATLVSAQPLSQLAIGVEASLWEDMTVNTMLPTPADESSEDGELRFTYQPLEAGTEFLWKVDLQVNPDIVLGNDGTLTVYDGDRPLVSTDLSIQVLP